MLLEQELVIAVREAETAAIIEKIAPPKQEETKLLPVYDPLLLPAPKPKRKAETTCLSSGPVIHLADCNGFKLYHVCATFDENGYLETVKIINEAVIQGYPSNSIMQFKSRNEAIAKKKYMLKNHNRDLLQAHLTAKLKLRGH